MDSSDPHHRWFKEDGLCNGVTLARHHTQCGFHVTGKIWRTLLSRRATAGRTLDYSRLGEF